MSANGRRRWRRYAKKCRHLARREDHKAFSTGAHERKVCGRAPERDSVFALSPPPWSPRNLVGASMSARKRKYATAVQAITALLDGRTANPDRLRMLRSLYRIGERLRPCRGCYRCREDLEPYYGSFRGGDPRDFDPDPDCSTEEERAMHAEHCAAWSRGESPGVKVSGLEWLPAGTYKHKDGTPNKAGWAFVERPGYGLGVNSPRRAHACDGSGVIAKGPAHV